jgi:hypothetical protein
MNLSDIVNPLNSQEVAISDLGIVYGIIIIAPAMLFLIQFLDSARWLGPFRAKNWFAIVFAIGSIVFMSIIAGVILPPSIALVQHPPTHVFIDSLGPGGQSSILNLTHTILLAGFEPLVRVFQCHSTVRSFGFWGKWWTAKEDRVTHVLVVL